MKKVILLATLMMSLQCFAAPVEISSTDGSSINIATIERSITVDTLNGRINIVETDAGGSTDMGSAMAPSMLLLTYFKDGEMINIQATFDLGSIYSLKSATKKSASKIEIVVEVKDINLKSSTKKITVDYYDLIKKAKRPVITVSEFETQTLNAKVIVSEDLRL